MKLFWYYALHTFKNQLRKLMKTWVLIFIVACMVIGGLIGLGASRLEEMSAEGEEVVAEEPVEELPDEQIDEETRTRKLQIVELIAGAVILGMFVYEAMSADRNGSKIFLPADVNLLFSAPMTPQSVLMFRLMTQLGTSILLGIYLLLQLPNLIYNAGLDIWSALAIIGTWCLLTVVARLFQVLLYLLASDRPRFRDNLHRIVYLVLAMVAGGFVLYWKRSGLTPVQAALGFFNAPASRYIPVWGWLKGVIMWTAEGSIPGLLLSLAGVGLTIVALIFIIRRTHADYYEDAMAKSEETAALMEAARSEKSGLFVTKKRKKDRSERLRRDGMNRGWGASVFFWKNMYNRFRFAHLGFFTKTMETYIFAATVIALLCRMVFHVSGSIPVVLALSGLVFFRAMGNPLEQDTSSELFILVPESSWAKLFWSLLGGTVNCLLDVLPAIIIGGIVSGGNILAMLAWVPFIASMDMYATIVGAFINVSVSVSAGKTIKQMVQVMFIYFGMLPDIAIIAIGFVLDSLVTAVLIATGVNLLLSAVFFALTPLFIEPGRGRSAIHGTESVDYRTARKTFSRAGFSLFMVLALATLVQLLLVSLLSDTAVFENSWGIWLITFAPMYLIAVPTALLILKKLPAQREEGTRLTPVQWLYALPVTLFMMYAGNIVGTLITTGISVLFSRETVNPIMNYAMDDNPIAKLLFLVVLAPMIEEFLCRRQIIDRIRQYGEKRAVIVSAVLFGLMHGNLSQMFYAFALGLVFGYIYLRTGRLRYTIALHMFVNFLGGIVGPYILEKVNFDIFENVSFDTPITQMIGSSGIVPLIMYGGTMFTLAIIGLVILCVRGRKLEFSPARQELEAGRRFSTVWVNPGMILAVAASLALVINVILAG